MKRTLLRIANATISPLGVQLYKCGMDMESVMRQLGRRAADIRTVVDIGASDGRWSRMAMVYFPHSKFIAVDPLVEREPKLKKLKERNSKFDYVLCVAGEKDNDTVSLTVGDDLDGSTVGGSQGTPRVVQSHSIDSIAIMQQCAGPFILKFDTHGFEVPILKGAANTLRETRYIVMEVYNYRHTAGTLLFYEMCSLLDSLGFRCFNLADPMQRPLDGALWQMDLFFARKEDECFHDSRYRSA
jgi:FkbM family methyltransferase